MATELLQTKLYIPRLRSKLVARPHLLDKLNRGLQRKLTLISAPAGFGKSTLVSTWVAQQERAVAWLSLDSADADLLRFLTYFTAALQTIMPTVGKDVMAALQLAQLPSIETTLTALQNQIAQTDTPFLLVLDDYHVLDSEEIDRCLNFLLTHQPPQMHLVIITRQDPNLPLPRLRVRRQMTELRSADLRFTHAEAALFLNRTMHLNLTEREIAALETRTEGWIAGLQMAALSIEGRTDAATFIAAFTGSNRFVLDYLVEEVLQRQPAPMRHFLLQTAILDQLCESLCNAVTERDDSGARLAALERGNLFVVPLDDARQWFRYHHLFADVLRAYLMQEQPTQVAALHRRASVWYEQQRNPTAAIRHALRGHDFERAAVLMEAIWPALFNGIRPATWLRFVQQLPTERVQASPILSNGSAWTLLHRGELEQADAHLQNAEQRLASMSIPPAPYHGLMVTGQDILASLPTHIHIGRVLLSLAQGDAAAAIQYGKRVLDVVPADVFYDVGLTKLFTGVAYWACGEMREAVRLIVDGSADLRHISHLYFQLLADAILAYVKVAQGCLNEATAIYERALQLVANQSGFVLREIADLYIGLADLHRERNDLSAAETYLQMGKQALSEQAIWLGSEARWCAAMARLRAATGDWSAALDLLAEGQRVHVRDSFPNLRPLAAQQAWVWLQQGRLDDAVRWAQQVDDVSDYLHEFEQLTVVRIQIAQLRREGNSAMQQSLLQRLERLCLSAEQDGRIGSIIAILVQQALAYAACGEHHAAQQALARALSLAEPERFVRVFVDENRPMRDLLSTALTQGAAAPYVMKLIYAIDEQHGADTPPAQPLFEPLSKRELQVLALIAAGHSNQAIADQLVIAVTTVKKHVSNIFGKLTVENRTEAVSRARDLDIL